MQRFLALFLLALVGGSTADWQISGAAGFGNYGSQVITTPAGTAQAGIGPRFVLNAAIGCQFGEHLAVEGAWTYQDGDFQLSSGGTKTAFDASAQALHADLLWFVPVRAEHLRPYLVGGTGGKFYTGSEVPGPRPLAQFGSFRQATDTRPLLTFGGGVEWKLSQRWALRLDLRDFATPFPTSVIVPAPGANLGGWLHDFVPSVGVTFR